MNHSKNAPYRGCRLIFARLCLGLLILFGGISQTQAEITIRLSVKFILNSDGTRPAGDGVNNIDISTAALFGLEVTNGNRVLDNTARGYKLQVVEYIDIQPSAPAGQPTNYWFVLNARTNRTLFEAAALANTATWRWNPNAINIYVNNSSSGQCSFPGAGGTITLGATIFTAGTVLHEVGHFFNLQHTHGADVNCNTFNPTAPLNTYLGDSDNLPITIPDHPCFTLDQLSIANLGLAYAMLDAGQRTAINTSWLNVMSYHQEVQLHQDQMDIWGPTANGSRLFACSGRTWFVAPGGFDDRVGDKPEEPLLTLAGGLSRVTSGDDVVLLRAGNYTTPAADGLIATRCTISAARGTSVIRKP